MKNVNLEVISLESKKEKALVLDVSLLQIKTVNEMTVMAYFNVNSCQIIQQVVQDCGFASVRCSLF